LATFAKTENEVPIPLWAEEILLNAAAGVSAHRAQEDTSYSTKIV